MRFYISDLSKASGLTPAHIVMIMNNASETLGDEDFSKGRGIARSLSVLGLKRLALIGAISKLGIGIIPSARLAYLFANEQPYGEVKGDLPSNCGSLVTRKVREDIYLWNEDFDYIGNLPATEREFKFLEVLLASGLKYEKKTLHGDLLMEIVDNSLIYMSTSNLAGINILDPHLQAAYKINNWDKGNYPNITHAWSVTEDELNKWQNIRENALTRSTVNVSLAIREAFFKVIPMTTAHRD